VGVGVSVWVAVGVGVIVGLLVSVGVGVLVTSGLANDNNSSFCVESTWIVRTRAVAFKSAPGAAAAGMTEPARLHDIDTMAIIKKTGVITRIFLILHLLGNV